MRWIILIWGYFDRIGFLILIDIRLDFVRFWRWFLSADEESKIRYEYYKNIFFWSFLIKKAIQMKELKLDKEDSF